MVIDEPGDCFPINGPSGSPVDARSMGIQEDSVGGALEGGGQVGILCNSDGLEEGEVLSGERFAVGRIFVAV
mgnify:CR=1 FL=1